MHRSRSRFLPIFLAILCLATGPLTLVARAETTDDLNEAIQEKQNRVKELDGLIGNYKDRIQKTKSEAASLVNQMDLLDQRVREKELAVERAKLEIESLGLEIRLMEEQIGAQEARIAKQKDLLASLLAEINRADETSTLEVLLAKPSLSEFFAQTEQVRRLQGDLERMMQKMKTVKADLENRQRERTEKQQAVEKERLSQRREELMLEAERNFKASLASETKNKETEFERIMYELRQQQQSEHEEISDLEDRLKEQLENIDDALARGDVLFSWPVDTGRGITAIFHDPTYPFRHLFEHPGTDIRAPVGTPVKAAAGGYVAWNKTGRQYGNYTMIIHPGGFATVYAHLSKFLAQPDTYVERGDVIALSGGRPGDAGAGLSSGPHLHFEVREDGIPVDAENYLPNLPEDHYDYYDEYRKLKVRP